MTTPAIVPTAPVKPDIVAEIDRVLALAALATPGEWQSGAAGNCNLVAYGGEDVRGVGHIATRMNIASIVAAHELFRTHGPDFRRLVENGLRYEWLRDNRSVEACEIRDSHDAEFPALVFASFSAFDYNGSQRDAAIDTARAQGGGHG